MRDRHRLVVGMYLGLLSGGILLSGGAAVVAGAQATTRAGASTNWLGFAVGAGRTTPCEAPRHCDRVTLSAEWSREMPGARYGAVRLVGLFELQLYSKGDFSSAPTNNRGELAVMYGSQWRSSLADFRVGTGVALGIDQRVEAQRATQRGYVGLPVDTQAALHLGRRAKFTLNGLATFGVQRITHRAALAGLAFMVP